MGGCLGGSEGGGCDVARRAGREPLRGWVGSGLGVVNCGGRLIWGWLEMEIEHCGVTEDGGFGQAGQHCVLLSVTGCRFFICCRLRRLLDEC